MNLQQPDTVQKLHKDYTRAGAWLIRTNTLQANAHALKSQGLADRAEAINNSGSALARAAVGNQGAVMGSIGGINVDYHTCPDRDALQHRLGEQMIYLSDTEVEFFMLEHVHQLEWALWLTRKIKSLSDAPVLAQLSVDIKGNTAEGTALAAAAQQLVEAGADALGLSCHPPHPHLLSRMNILLEHGLPVSLMLSTDIPLEKPSRLELEYKLTPEAYADTLADLGSRDVAILGGCCGAGVPHIKALAHRLQRKPLSETLTLP